MEKVNRALIEESFYRPMGGVSNKRGYILSAEFAPRLIVHPDGTENDGAVLARSLQYLDAHHTLRLSVWDILGDELLRQAATAAPLPARRYVAPAPECADMTRWYRQYSQYEDGNALLAAYRPSLLDAVATA